MPCAARARSTSAPGSGDMDGVDVPRLQRTGVQRPEDPHERRRAGEGPERVGEQVGASRPARSTTAAATNTGRRPKASANPLVGSSSAKTMKPITAKALKACATVSPRSSASRVIRPAMRPTGNHRVNVRVEEHPACGHGESTWSVMAAPCPVGASGTRPRCAGRPDRPTRLRGSAPSTALSSSSSSRAWAAVTSTTSSLTPRASCHSADQSCSTSYHRCMWSAAVRT